MKLDDSFTTLSLEEMQAIVEEAIQNERKRTLVWLTRIFLNKSVLVWDSLKAEQLPAWVMSHCMSLLFIEKGTHMEDLAGVNGDILQGIKNFQKFYEENEAAIQELFEKESDSLQSFLKLMGK